MDNEWEDVTPAQDSEWEDVSPEQDKSFLQSAGEAVNDFSTNLSNNWIGRTAAEVASYPGALVQTIGTDKPFEEARQQLLAQDQQQYVDAAKRSPTASLVGTAAGNMAAGPQGAVSAAPGFVNGAKAIGANAAVDAGMGALDAASQGQSPQDIAQAALLSGAISGATGGTLAGVNYAAKKAGSLTNSLANNTAVNALGGTPREAGFLSDRADEIGPLLREGNTIKFGQSKQGLSDAVDALREQTGKRLGEARSMAQGDVNVGNLLANKWEQGVTSSGLTAGEEASQKAYMDYIKNLPENISVDRAQEILQPLLKHSSAIATDAPVKQGLGELYQDLRGAQKEVVQSSLPPEWASQYAKDSKAYALLGGAESAAERQANRASAAESFGLKDLFVGSAAGATSGLVFDDPTTGAIAGAVGSKLLRGRAATSAASLANNLDKVVQKAPHLLGKYAPVLQQAAARGGNALNATSYMLQKQDPEYRKLINGETDENP